jgi:hypothetical protein
VEKEKRQKTETGENKTEEEDRVRTKGKRR